VPLLRAARAALSAAAAPEAAAPLVPPPRPGSCCRPALIALSSFAGAVQPICCARTVPRWDGVPAPMPSPARPSLKPASTRETSVKEATLLAPRVGTTSAPSRSLSTSSRAEAGVWLSKNSQLTITTGA
jgi:hypothetical protein